VKHFYKVSVVFYHQNHFWPIHNFPIDHQNRNPPVMLIKINK